MSLRLNTLPPPENNNEPTGLEVVRKFLENSHGIPPMEFSSNEEKLAWIRMTLERFSYEFLSREDKGVIRKYLEAVSGYSRAQVARHIKHYRTGGTTGLLRDPIEKGTRWISTSWIMNPTQHPRVATLALLLAVSLGVLAQSSRTTPASLTFLNGDKTEVVDSAGRGSHVVASVTQNEDGQTSVDELYSVTNDFVALDSGKILRRTSVAERREARLDRLRGSAPENIAVADVPSRKGNTPEPIVRSPEMASVLSRFLDAIGVGQDGQVLMFQNGTVTWGTPSVNSGGGRRPSGGGNGGDSGGSNGGNSGGGGGGGGGSGNNDANDGEIEGHDHQNSAGGGTLDIGAATTGTLRANRGGTGFASYSTGDLLVGTVNGDLEKLSANGSQSGYVLTVFSGGVVRWAAGGGGGAGDVTSAAADARYVNVSGDSMTGTLIINPTSGTIGLEVIGVASGRILHAQDELRSSGSLVVEGTAIFNSSVRLNGVTYAFPTSDGSSTGKVLKTDGAGNLVWSDDNTGAGGSKWTDGGDISYLSATSDDLAVGGSTPGSPLFMDVSERRLEVMNISGGWLHAADTLLSSGSLVIEGSAVLNATLSVASDITTAGNFTLNSDADSNNAVLTFASDSANETVSWLNAADRFEFSDDVAVTGNITSSGGIIATSDSKFKANITINSDSGAADAVLTFGSDGTDETFRFLNAEDRYELSDDVRITGGTYASGALIVDGAATFKSTLRVNGVTYTFPTSDGTASGKVLKTNSAGVLSWSADIDTDTNTTYSAGQGLTLNGTTFSLSSAFSGTSLEVIGTASGRILHAQDELRSSGSLIVEGATVLNSTLLSVGNITTNGDLILNNDQTAANTVLTFGSDSTNETVTFLNAADRFEFSDDVAVTGNIFGSGTLILKKTAGTSTGNTLIVDTKGLVYDASNKRVGIGTTTPGRDLEINRSVQGTVGMRIYNPTDYEFGYAGIYFGNSENADHSYILQNQPSNTNFAGSNSLNLVNIDGPIGFATDTTTRMVIGSTGNVGIGTLSPTAKFEVKGIISGSQLEVASNIIGSGALIIGGAGSIKGNLTINSDATAANTVLTFGSDSTNETLTFLNAEDRFEFSDDVAVTGSIYGSGSFILKRHSGTSTGNLLIVDSKGLIYDASNKRVGIGQTGPETALDVVGTISGSSLTISNLRNCDTIDTNGAGVFTCGTDDGGSGGIDYATIVGSFVNTSGDTMTGAFIVDASAAAVALEIIGTASGRILHAQDELRSSGSLVVEGLSVLNGALTVRGAFSGSSLTTAGGNITMSSLGAAVFNENSVDADFRIESDATTHMFFLDAGANRIGIGTAAPETVLDVVGTMSGSDLVISNLRNCDTIDTNGAGVLVCGTDTGGSSGVEYSAIVGSFVNTSGDTMTGSLVLNGANVGIRASGSFVTLGQMIGSGTLVVGSDALIKGNLTINSDIGAANTVLTFGSDSTSETLTFLNNEDRFEFSDDLHATGNITTSGSLIVEKLAGSSTGNTLIVDNKGLVYDASNKRVGIGTSAPKATLDILGTLSGSSIQSFGLYADCDGTINQKLLYDKDTGKFSCGDDQNSTYTAGQGLSLVTSTFQLSSAFSGTSLEIIGTASGRILHAQDELRSSGSLVVEGLTVLNGALTVRGAFSGSSLTTAGGNITMSSLGAAVFNENSVDADFRIESDAATHMFFLDAGANRIGIGTAAPETVLDVVGTMSGSDLVISNLRNCDTIDTDGAGNLICGTDTGGSSGVEYSTIVGSFVNTSGDTMTGSLILNGAGVGLRSSGSIATLGQLIGSGVLVVGNDALIKGNLTINSDIGAANTVLTFGSDSTSETLTFLNAADRFEFSDDVGVTGNLTASGTMTIAGAVILQSTAAITGNVTTNGNLALNNDQTAADTLLTFGSDGTNETLTFLNNEDRFELSDDLNVTGGLYASGTLIIGGAGTVKGDFTINSDQTAANTVLTFGSDSTNETLTFLNNEDRFEVSDDLNVTGGLYASGALIISGNGLLKSDLTINSDAGAVNTVLTFGSDSTNETMTFLNAADRFEVSDDFAATGNITTSGAIIATSTSLFKANLTINSDADSNDAVLTFGSDSTSETMTWANATDRWDFTDDLNTTGSITASGAIIANAASRFKNNLGVAGTLSGAILVVSSNSTFAMSNITFSAAGAAVFNELGNDVDFRIESDTNANMFFLDAGANRVGIGTAAPETALDVIGTMSGSDLVVSNLRNCDTIDTNGAGVLTCGTDSGAGGGLAFTEASSYYVNVSGDTMTGALILNGAGVGITASGTILTKSKLLASGALVVSGSGTFGGHIMPGPIVSISNLLRDEEDHGQYIDMYCPTSANCKVVWYDATNGDLEFFDCDNEDCSAGTQTTVEATDDIGQYPSIYCPTSADCKIAYYDVTNTGIKFADCNDEACSAPAIRTLEADTDDGKYTDIDCPSATDCKISYAIHDGVDNDLRFADCNDAACSAPAISSLDTTGDVGTWTSIACPTATNCKISYHDETNGTLKFADCNDGACSVPVINTIDATSDRGETSSIVCPASNDCKIAYEDESNSDLYFIDCTADEDCSSNTITLIDSVDDVGDNIMLSCPSATNCKIAYRDETNSGVKFVDCDGATCSAHIKTSVDARDDKGAFVALSCPSSSNCKIAYRDATASDPLFADCSAESCRPNVNLGGSGRYLQSIYAFTSNVFVANTSGFDVAENYPVLDQSIQPGHVVSLIGSGKIIGKTTQAYDALVLGIISTQPGVVLSGWENSGQGPQRPVALSGRVPVRISGENGTIAVGDYLTSATIAGHAMKATQAGPVLGRALSTFTGTGTGMIEVFVQTFYYGGTSTQVTLSSAGSGYSILNPATGGLLAGAAFTIRQEADNVIGLDIRSLATGEDGAALRLATAGSPHILFGSGSTYDVSIRRTTGSTLAVNGLLVLTAEDDDNRALLALDSEETSGAQDMLRLTSDVGTDENLVMRVTASGSVFTDGPVSTTGADYAEWFVSEDAKESIPGVRTKLVPGEVVCIDVTQANAVRRCTRDGDNNVMGIVSTNPAFIGNALGGADGLPVPGYVLVGLIGQVPGKVMVEAVDPATGLTPEPIRPGDSLTPSSVPGVARRARSGEPTVGVALEGLESGQGTIKILISRRNQSITAEAVEQRILESIANMEIEDEVQLMLAKSLEDLNFNATITDEVHTQVQGLNIDLQMHAVLNERLGTGSVLGRAEKVLRLTDENIMELRAAFRVVGPTTLSGSLQIAGAILGTSLELDQNLTVGGSARIGQDLHVDGSLVVNEIISPNSLFVDGDLNLGGTIHAAAIKLASGGTLQVAGGLTLNGKLTVDELEINGGSISVEDIMVRGAMEVMGDITISGLARFLGDVDVGGQLIVSNRQAGYAKIPKTGTAVTIFFGSGFNVTPVVSASPDVPVLYAVSKATQTGFTIRLAGPAAEDVTFSWLALGTAAPETVQGMQGSLLENGNKPFTVDGSGIPYSDSDAVFNACIRNQATGCENYRRDTYEWVLGDIIFTYRTDLTPPLLVLPDGYEIVVVDNEEEVPSEGSTEEETEESEEPEETEELPIEEDAEGGEEEEVADPVEGSEEEVTEPTEPVDEPVEETPTEEAPTVEPEVVPPTEETVPEEPSEPEEGTPAEEIPAVEPPVSEVPPTEVTP